jgi:acyl-CoA synthetase (AMP-forming)/AMP-acid ligase II
MEGVTQTLNAAGVGRSDRVAVVLPNGPEMATAFVTVAAAATIAPLNPGYREEEFAFYFADLRAKALIIEAGSASPACRVALAHKLRIFELSPELAAPAGVLHLTPTELDRRDFAEPTAHGSDQGYAQPEDTALVLHTSGTTSKPKLVPLTHANICTSAHNIRCALGLVKNDRCLNVMPLFHIHGLIGGLLSSLMAGGSSVCTPGFYAPKFFEWLEEFRPTWYTAVPTMHQSILARAKDHQHVISKGSLRLIRSSSSALPPQVMMELEETFSVPVIESYGMTEASHQMASNPLPPATRKPGSVGLPAGPEIAIMDETGSFLPSGQIGEIVIRGAAVMAGYENNPAANQTAFTRGWFHTGDNGHLDVDGYLFISGRIKEIVNRGGEKISPREVDEILLQHPAVAQAVSFAVPHSTLGEDIAAVIVLKPNLTASEQGLREFAARRLADFKVPGRVVFVDEIPKGPTGKIQRIGLAKQLGLNGNPATVAAKEHPYIEPRTPAEHAVWNIWKVVLGVQKISVNEPFLDVGGDSVLAAQIVSRLKHELNLDLSLASFFYAKTIEEQARTVEMMLLNEAAASAGNSDHGK